MDVDWHHTAVLNVPQSALTEYFDTVTLYHGVLYWQQMRSVDKITSITIEPTFWAKPWSLPLFSGFVKRLRVSDPDIIVSVVSYEPQPCTGVVEHGQRRRCRFQGTLPLQEQRAVERGQRLSGYGEDPSVTDGARRDGVHRRARSRRARHLELPSTSEQ